jgi:arginine-tRNA-protein transferase
VPARIPVAQFNPNRQQKRIFKRNADLQVRPVNRRFSEEYFDLYQRYIEQRHADGDMYPPSRDQFSTFLVRDLPFSRFYEFRLDGRLLAVAVTDLLPNGLSAVYTFYEPDEERRSLGRFAILWQIAEASAWGWKRCTSDTGSRTAKDELQDPISPHRIADQSALGNPELKALNPLA